MNYIFIEAGNPIAMGWAYKLVDMKDLTSDWEAIPVKEKEDLGDQF